MPSLTFPSIVYGQLTSLSNRSPVGEVTLTITNTRTGDTISIVTNFKGEYTADAQNFENGYTVGDTVEVSIGSTSSPKHDDNIRIDQGRIEFK